MLFIFKTGCATGDAEDVPSEPTVLLEGWHLARWDNGHAAQIDFHPVDN